MMSKLIFVILLAVLLPLAAAAQTKEWGGQGYVFVAPTVVTGGGFGLHIGGGGEGLVYKGLGVGGEIGYLGSPDGLRDGIGILSTDISYHFTKATKSRKFAPFVTGGYSMLFRGSAVNSINIGGGANWWFKERIGLRLELRDHTPLRFRSLNVFSVRIGLAFR
jgi:hypothetical protein